MNRLLSDSALAICNDGNPRNTTCYLQGEPDLTQDLPGSGQRRPFGKLAGRNASLAIDQFVADRVVETGIGVDIVCHTDLAVQEESVNTDRCTNLPSEIPRSPRRRP
jgi:hypothetical protein